MVAVLRAGLAIGVGDRAGAIRQLESAYEGFEKVTLHAHAAAARDVCGSIRNDELGQRLREQAAAFFKSQEVRDPAAFTRMLMPGRWTC